MKRLLVATDFSTRSDRAIRRATLIARKLGAALTLVHVVDVDQPAARVASEKASAAVLLKEAASSLSEIDGIEAEWMAVADDVHVGILAAARECASDLIVVGPHRHRLRDVFVGTTAERVAQNSSFPLLIAAEPPTAHYKRTLLALGLDEASRTAALTALAIGVFDHTDVVIMHAFDAIAANMMKRTGAPTSELKDYLKEEENAAAEKLRILRSELGLPSTCQAVVAMKGTPAVTILDSAEAFRSDLVVVGTNQRTGIERMFVGSVAAEVIRDAKHDILIIPVDQAD